MEDFFKIWLIYRFYIVHDGHLWLITGDKGVSWNGGALRIPIAGWFMMENPSENG